MRRAAILIAALIATSAHAQPLPDEPAPKPKRAKVIAAASIAAMHAAYATWSYFAWYRDADNDSFHLEHTDAFGVSSYSGGADKLGHAWSNYALTRATTNVLTAGGWERLPSSLVSAGLTELAFTLTEIQDGYVFGFDYKDLVANAAGAGLGVLMENVPEVDRLIDFKVQYFPSKDYRRAFRDSGSVDVGQDYTGQSYLLGLHLGALPRADESEWLYWTRFVDLAIGFEAHHYSPTPVMRVDAPRQTVYMGVAINMQGVLTHLLPDSTGRRVGRGAFEVFAVPFTTLRYVEASRSP